MHVADLFSIDALRDDHARLAIWLEQFTDPVDILRRLNELFGDIDGQEIKGDVQKGAYISGPVRIGEGSVVHAGVVIEGPAMIGKNVSLRPHANIRKGTWLSNNCVVGHGADVKHTLALPGAKIQDGTFAGDSVLGHGARVGSGAILANRKFNQTTIKVQVGEGEPEDSNLEFFGAILGDYARLGANVVTSPGTIVGAHTWVGSGVVLSGTIAPDRLVTVKQDLEIREKSRVQLKSGIGEYEHV